MKTVIAFFVLALISIMLALVAPPWVCIAVGVIAGLVWAALGLIVEHLKLLRQIRDRLDEHQPAKH